MTDTWELEIVGNLGSSNSVALERRGLRATTKRRDVMAKLTKIRKPPADLATQEEWSAWYRISREIERLWPHASVYMVMIRPDGLLQTFINEPAGHPDIDWPTELRNAAAYQAQYDRKEQTELDASCP